MNKIKTIEETGLNISLTQENLIQGLSVVSRISARNVNLPILQNVLIKIQNNVLKLSTTNLELAINCLVRGRVDLEGEGTVPARLLTDFISLLPPDKVDLTFQGQNLKIRSGKFETELQGTPSSEFPVIPQVSEGTAYLIPADQLREALTTVMFAVSQHESRPELTGVFFGFNQPASGGSTLTLAATDSYRLAEAIIPLGPESRPDQHLVIVPARTAIELTRILGLLGNDVNAPVNLEMLISENQIQLSAGNLELISRVVAGQYPDYRQIIPAHFETEATLSREELIQAVKAASLFSKAGLYDVRLNFKTGGPLVVHAAEAGTGEYQSEVGGEVTGKENMVVVNYKYLLEGLAAIRDEEVVFKMIDAANPCLLVPKNKEERYLYIVMPIKQ